MLNSHILLLKLKSNPVPKKLIISYGKFESNDFKFPIAFLSEREQHICNSYRNLNRKMTYQIGRYAAKTAVSLLLNESNLQKLEILVGCFSQPIIQYEQFSMQGVSLSHTKNATIALAFPASICAGVDIELVSKQKENTLYSNIENHEKNIVDQLDKQNQRLQYRVLLWTIKESLSKAVLTGLTLPLSFFSVKSVTCHKNIWVSEFVHFKNFKCLSFFSDQHWISLTLPAYLIEQIQESTQHKVELLAFWDLEINGTDNDIHK